MCESQARLLECKGANGHSPCLQSVHDLAIAHDHYMMHPKGCYACVPSARKHIALQHALCPILCSTVAGRKQDAVR